MSGLDVEARMEFAALTLDGSVATIRMNDTARRNALSPQMLDALIQAFDGLPAEIRAVVLRAGAEDRVWCAGFDIAELAAGVDPLAQDGALHALFDRVRQCKAPVIGMLHGSAWGGGTDLALRCDILIGDPTASLAFTPARLGLPYDQEGLLNAMLRGGPALAMEMFATADPVDAERALQAGLLNRLVPAAALEEVTYAMAHRIADNAPLTVTSAKRHIRALAAALSLPSALSQLLHEGRNAALNSADYAEGLAAFRAKRKPRFAGS